ncbi:CHAD domain-containing protein [Gandjariella thermophila]|uniref:CHAD domain-containing protein n=1 Tax=Gandjariella thermophila TaxID=1931992 RepID=A0A4D4J0I8_9PSEU|nr:CHAD domain-containing protein [Gandjariella thermophila]GDY29971.1 CHAD domain-containing protein [Gandjariella thermophila]
MARSSRQESPPQDDLPPVPRLVRDALRVRFAALREHEAGTRSGADPEDLHQMRVAVRRMRAVLAAAGDAVDRRWADELRAELRWLGQVLGPVRDLDVLIGRLRAESADFTDDERHAVEALLRGLTRKRRAARQRLLRALRSRRYADLLAALDKAVEAGPPAAPVDVAPLDLVRRPYRKALRQVRKVDEDGSDEALHALRIRGKRLRYAAELIEPDQGRPVRKLVKAVTVLQDVLGEHQDAAVAEKTVRELATAEDSDGDAHLAFVAGRLAERERARRAAYRNRWPAAWQEVDRRARKLLSTR